jgi:serine/threonine-protein kinase
MGAVWRARHEGLDVPCAVKFMQAELSHEPALKARFEREAKAAAQLRSPHVVQMLDYGFWRDHPYIAMELLEGEDLCARLARRGRLSPQETIAVLAQVGRALSKAHAAGLVHRDLKPENVFLVRDDDRELAKVLDFGIVSMPGGDPTKRSTRHGVMLGTPAYMSPEQAMGQRDVDLRADLWALGVLAFECLTGEQAFRGATVMEIAIRILGADMPVPSEICPDLPPGFDAWWARAASRDRDQRFASATEQIEALAIALGLPRRSILPRGKFSGAPLPRASSADTQRASSDGARSSQGSPVVHGSSAEITIERDSAPSITTTGLTIVSHPPPPRVSSRRRLIVAISAATLGAFGALVYLAHRTPAQVAPDASAALVVKAPAEPAPLVSAAAPRESEASVAVLAPAAAPLPSASAVASPKLMKDRFTPQKSPRNGAPRFTPKGVTPHP